MKSAPARFAFRYLLWTAALLATVACSRKHEGPEVGDSVTNWLRSCSNNGECRGGAMCIRALCSIPCSDQRPDGCDVLSGDAVCDAEAELCDLPCESATACSALGADFACNAGRCRPTPQDEAATAPASAGADKSSEPTPVSATLLDDDLQLMQGEPRAQHFEVADTTALIYDADATFALGELSPRTGNQVASWQDDHWLVLWEGHLDAIDRRWQFNRARIYPGRYELERIALPYDDLLNPSTFHSEDGRLALVNGGRRGGRPCSIAVTDIAKGISYAPSYFQCEGGVLVDVTTSAVPDSDDWMLLWSADGLDDDTDHPFRVARYSPLASRWSAGPWEMHAKSASLPGISAGSMSSYVWSPAASSQDFLSQFEVGPLSDLEAMTFAPIVRALPPASAEIRNTVTLPNGIMLLTWNLGEQPSASVVGNDGARVGPIPIDMVSNGEFEALYLPRLNRVALCLTDPAVEIVLLDEQARQVGSRIVIAMGSRFASCNLAWSNTELLVTWNMGDDAPDQPIFARVIDWEELAP